MWCGGVLDLCVCLCGCQAGGEALPEPSGEELEAALVEAIYSILARLVRPADEATAQAMDDAGSTGTHNHRSTGLPLQGFLVGSCA